MRASSTSTTSSCRRARPASCCCAPTSRIAFASGYFGMPREDRRGLAQPVVPHRRPRGARCRRRLPLRRPHQGRDPPARREHLVVRGRAGAAEPSGGGRGRGLSGALGTGRGRGDGGAGRARRRSASTRPSWRASASRACRTSRCRATSTCWTTCRAPRTARCRSTSCASAASPRPPGTAAPARPPPRRRGRPRPGRAAMTSPARCPAVLAAPAARFRDRRRRAASARRSRRASPRPAPRGAGGHRAPASPPRSPRCARPATMPLPVRSTCATRRPSQPRSQPRPRFGGDRRDGQQRGADADRTSVWSITADEWDDVLAVNLRGSFFGCRIAGRHMRERGRGRIVNLVVDRRPAAERRDRRPLRRLEGRHAGADADLRDRAGAARRHGQRARAGGDRAARCSRPGRRSAAHASPRRSRSAASASRPRWPRRWSISRRPPQRSRPARRST